MDNKAGDLSSVQPCSKIVSNMIATWPKLQLIVWIICLYGFESASEKAPPTASNIIRFDRKNEHFEIHSSELLGLRSRRNVPNSYNCPDARTEGKVILPDNRKQIMIGLLLPFTLSVPGSEYREGGAKFYAEAFNMAVDRINNDSSILPGYKIDYMFNDTRCNELDGIRAMHYQYHKRKDQGLPIHGFIGLGCHCSSPVKFASAMNVPVVSHMCSRQGLSHKKLFPTFARTYPIFKMVIPSIKALLRTFNWKTVALISSNDSTKYAETSDDLACALETEISFKEGMKTIQYDPKEKVFDRILFDVKRKARIIILYMEYKVMREGLLHASRNGMANGEYVFILVELDSLSLEGKLNFPFKWFVSSYKETNKDSHEMEVKKMFPHTLILGYKLGDTRSRAKYRKYTKELKNRIGGRPFCSPYGIYRRLPVPLENIYLYDAVQVLALAMNKTLNRGKKITDGLEVIASMKDLSYQSIDGSSKKMSDDLNSKDYFSLLAYDINNGTNEMIVSEVGHFDERGILVSKRPIRWLQGKQPKDTPACGFNDELCKKANKEKGSCRELMIVAVSVSTVAVIALLSLYTFMRWKRTSSMRIGWTALMTNGKDPFLIHR